MTDSNPVARPDPPAMRHHAPMEILCSQVLFNSICGFVAPREPEVKTRPYLFGDFKIGTICKP
jgi:hypothetical protein